LSKEEKRKTSYLKRFIERYIPEEEVEQDVTCLFMNQVSLSSLCPGPGETNVQSKIESVQNLIQKQKNTNLEEDLEKDLEEIDQDIREFKRIQRKLTSKEVKNIDDIEDKLITLKAEIEQIEFERQAFQDLNGEPDDVKRKYD